MIVLRPAIPAEHQLLTDLTRRSKAHWGYDQAFMALFAEELTVTVDTIEQDRVTVLEEDGRIAGYAHLRREHTETVELVSLFIDPWAIRRGYGQRLWEEAVTWARSAGYRQLVLESDPHAEGFYSNFGAVEIGQRESTVKPGRFLAIMTFDLTDPSPKPDVP